MVAVRGGDKFPVVLAQIGRAVADGGLVRVGFLEGATYAAMSSTRARNRARRSAGITAPIRTRAASSTTLNVPTVATFNEFGTSRAPPRPFFRNMIRAKSHEWGPALAIQLKRTDYDVKTSLGRLGEGISGQLRQSIVDLVSPPLAASTIARKGFDKPLISTGHMLASVDYEVKL